MNKMKAGVFGALALLGAMLVIPGQALAAETIIARLVGFQEVPAVSTTGGGHFQATISSDQTSIEFQLDYTLEGSVQQAHIHLGQTSVNGGIVIFLCTNLAPPPGVPVPPPCPPSPGTVSGTRTAADVVAVASQGIFSGDFAKVLNGIRSGVAYANVHSGPDHPGGEIRGQLRTE